MEIKIGLKDKEGFRIITDIDKEKQYSSSEFCLHIDSELIGIHADNHEKAKFMAWELIPAIEKMLKDMSQATTERTA